MQIDRRLTSRPAPLRPRQPFRLSLPGFRFWFSLAALGLIGALIVLLVQMLLFTRTLDRLPAGQIAAEVPVGGLTREEATQRLAEVYNAPIVLDYRGSQFHLAPAQIEFTLDSEAMLAQTPVGIDDSGWSGFWAYLWGVTPPVPAPIPLQAAFDQELLNSFLADVSARYDDPGTPARPNPATLGFIPGSAGRALERDAAFALINTALRSATARAVTLPVNDFAQAPPTFDTLTELLYTDIRLHQFNGTAHIYLADLQTGESLNIAMRGGQPFDVNGGIAFSGMSTIKVPVMVTFFRYKDGALTPDEQFLFAGIFGESANEYTDLILGLLGAKQQGGGLVGANMASDTMAELGLPNTYLAGLLNTLGAITTPRITPANSRTDIDLASDRFSQTSADDMGRLLAMIYDCSVGRGKLIETFPDQFTAEECQMMLDILSKNEVGPIFIAGSAPGAKVIHKHGWDSLPLNNVGDAAYVFSSGGDYVITVYLHRDEPVPFDTANRLIVSLGTAVFNFYNRR